MQFLVQLWRRVLLYVIQVDRYLRNFYLKKFHKQIGEYAKIKGLDLLLGFGELTKYSIESFGSSGMFFKSKAALVTFLNKEISKNDHVLLKGSRGMHMEQFIKIGDNT